MVKVSSPVTFTTDTGAVTVNLEGAGETAAEAFANAARPWLDEPERILAPVDGALAEAGEDGPAAAPLCWVRITDCIDSKDCEVLVDGQVVGRLAIEGYSLANGMQIEGDLGTARIDVSRGFVQAIIDADRSERPESLRHALANGFAGHVWDAAARRIAPDEHPEPTPGG